MFATPTRILLCLVACLVVSTATLRASAQQSVELSQTVGEELPAQGDEVYYRVTLSEEGPLVVMLRGSSAAPGYSLEVREGDVSGPTVGVKYEYGNDQTLEVSAPTPGDYYVVVRNAAPGARSFELRAEQRAAVSVSPGASFANQALWAAGDTFTYEVEVQAGEPLIALLVGQEFATNYELEVREGARDGAAVGVSREYGNGLSVEVPSPRAGTYFVVVRNLADGARTFDLQVAQRTAQSVVAGTTIDDQPLTTIGDAWYYTIPIATPDPLLVMVQGTTFASAYEVEVHRGSLSGPEEGVLREFEYGQSVEVEAPTAGDYFIVVRAAAVDAESFSLGIEQRPAIALQPGDTVTGESLWVAGDTWYYRVAASGSPLLALLRGSTYASGYSLEVHEGTINGPLVGVRHEGETQLGVEVQAPATSTYFVVVRSTTDGERLFDLGFEERSPQLVFSGSHLRDQSLWAVGDAWYYRYEATTTDPLLVLIQGSGFASDYQLELREGSLAGALVGNPSEVGSDHSIELQNPIPGEYFAVVRSTIDGERTFDLTVDQRVVLPLDLGTASAQQQLSGQGDTRYYAVTLPSAVDGLEVRLSGSELAAAYEVTVHQGSLDGPEVGVLRQDGYDAIVDVLSPAADEYYVVVQNARPGIRTFHLRVDLAAARVDHISPDYGGNAGRVTVTVAGRFLQDITALRLIGADGAETATSDLTQVQSGTHLRGTLDLQGVGPGLADVVVITGTGQEVRLDDAFTVEAGGAADLWVEVVGPTVARIGVGREYSIVIGNSGNVDSESALPVVLAVPEGSSLELDGWAAWSPGPDTTEQPWLAGAIVRGLAPQQHVAIPVRATARGTDFNLLAQLVDVLKRTFFPVRRDCPNRPKNKNDCVANPPPDGSVIFQDDPSWKLGGGHEGIVYYDDGEAFVWENIFWEDGSAGTGFSAWDSFCDRTFSWMGGWQTYLTPAQLGISDRDIQDRLKPWLREHSPYGSSRLTYTCEMKCTDAVHEAFSEGLGSSLIAGRDHHVWDTPAEDLKNLGCEWLGPRGKDWSVVPDFMKAEACSAVVSLGNLSNTIGDLIASVRHHVEIIRSVDPNAKYGPAGYGEQRAVSASHPLPYLITFENLETASASAQEVTITDQLDSSLVDLDTFSLGPITFGDRVITPPSGLTHYIEDIDLRPESDLVVRVAAELDQETGVVTWRFTSLDPETGLFTEDVLAGFLPPNTSPPAGEGSVAFTVQPYEGLPTNTVIQNGASIVFDTNDPIVTETWVNTLDGTAPTSAVSALPVTSDSASFEVCWSGQDEGAGISDYTVFVAVDGQAPEEWLAQTTDTCATYEGTNGSTYEFFVSARDGAGNRQEVPSVPDAVTTIVVRNGGEGGTSGASGTSRSSGGSAGVGPAGTNGGGGASSTSDTPGVAGALAAAGAAAGPLSAGGEPPVSANEAGSRGLPRSSAGRGTAGNGGPNEPAGGQSTSTGGAGKRDRGGCGCRAAGASRARPMSALLLLALLAFRRSGRTCQRRRKVAAVARTGPHGSRTLTLRRPVSRRPFTH